MKKMIVVKLFIKGRLIAKAKNIKLDYFSTTLMRKFYFFDVESKQKDIFLQKKDEIQVNVYHLNDRRDNSFSGTSFNLIVHTANYADPTMWTIEGDVKGEDGCIPSYEQGVVDVYNYWGAGKELEWNNLPPNISVMDYIYACMDYSSISRITPEKNVIEIDFQYVKTELEFSCCFAEEFMGKRSYMGRYLDTFKDCLLTLYHHRKGYFDDKCVKLKYKHIVLSNEQKALIEEVTKILEGYKFVIEVI